MTRAEKIAMRAQRLAEQAKEIHQLQHPMDVDELRARFDDLCRITEGLALAVEQLADECTTIRNGEVA